MTLLVLVIVATVIAGAAAMLTLRWPRHRARTAPLAVRAAREAGAAIRRHPGPRSALAARLDPEAATGLALTVALVVAVGGGVLLGVLAYLARGNTDLVRLDAGVANWGHRHASASSTEGLNVITHLGEPMVVAALAALVAFGETVRTRSPWVVPFVLVVVAGNGVLTTSVKNLADRVRPTMSPVAETLGPSFPSGHSSWSAAFFAAAALLLSRGRGRRARAALAGVAAGLVVTVAGSRVLLGVHWLSDVIAGLALGSAWFAICAIAFGGRLLRFGAAAEEAARGGEQSGHRPAHAPASVGRH
jgi:membrane-associated phospholipid phosphatase